MMPIKLAARSNWIPIDDPRNISLADRAPLVAAFPNSRDVGPHRPKPISTLGRGG